jgi:NAD-dependent DNA ligase
MRDRYDIFGTLPDVIEDDWIEDIENLGEKLREFTQNGNKQTYSTSVTRRTSRKTTTDGSFASAYSRGRMSQSGYRGDGESGNERTPNLQNFRKRKISM